MPDKTTLCTKYFANVCCPCAYIRTTECQNGGIRLQGGANANEGRVEVCNENRWGSVCDDNWGTTDAMVACGQLGFATAGMYNNVVP